MRCAITHRPQDLPRSKRILAEGRTLEEDIPLSTDDFIGVYAKPESCEGNDRCLSGLQNLWIYSNLVRRQEKFCNACEDDRVLECDIR